MNFILTVLGAVLIIEGIPYFAFPAKVKQWAETMHEVTDGSLRLLGALTMAVGLILLFALRMF